MNRPEAVFRPEQAIAQRNKGIGRWPWRHLARRLGRITFDSLVVWGSVVLFVLPPDLAEAEQPADAEHPDTGVPSRQPLSADELRWLVEFTS